MVYIFIFKTLFMLTLVAVESNTIEIIKFFTFNCKLDIVL